MDLCDRSRRSLGKGCARVGTSAPACAARSEGSVSDLEALFRTHWPRAFRAAYLVTHDAGAAEDIAQESFLAAIRSLDRFDRRRPFGPWLHRIVVNRAIDWTRARKLRGEVELSESRLRRCPRRTSRRRDARGARTAPSRAPRGDRDALPPRVHARRDRRGARPPARNGQLAPAPRARRAGRRAVKHELERIEIPGEHEARERDVVVVARGVRRAAARARRARRWPRVAAIAVRRRRARGRAEPARTRSPRRGPRGRRRRARPAGALLPPRAGPAARRLGRGPLGRAGGRLEAPPRPVPRGELVAVRPLRRRGARERARRARAGRRRALDACAPGRSVPALGRLGDRYAHRVSVGRNVPRVVAGDGTGDRPVCAASARPTAPAWRPGAGFALALVAPSGDAVRRRSRRLRGALDAPRPRRPSTSRMVERRNAPARRRRKRDLASSTAARADSSPATLGAGRRGRGFRPERRVARLRGSSTEAEQAA